MAGKANPVIVDDGLILFLDASNSRSYPGSGVSWNDLSGFSKNGVLVNGVSYSDANNGSFVFDGMNDYVASVSNITLANAFSISLWIKHTNSAPSQESYITLGSDRIVVQENENGNLNLYVSDATQQGLWTWGWANEHGQLGVNDLIVRSTPVTTILGGTNWKFISASPSYISAIKTDGTLWVWGRNTNGQLGINSTTTRSTPVTTILGGTNWKSVFSGNGHTAAIKTDGSLWIWGSNTYGQLGINETTNRSTPITTILGGTNWKQVSAGGAYVAAIKTDGTLWLWGYNYFGQLGVNSLVYKSTPVTTILGGTNWKSISCIYNNTAAIKTDGSLWIWGSNTYGQLGINSFVYKSTPVTTILGGTNWKSVSPGDHTAAIKTDGTLWTWGNNYYGGQLGINATTARSTPVTTILGGTNWKSVSCAYLSTLALKTDGTLWLWGANQNLELAINDTIDRSTPVTTILSGTNWKSISCNGLHTVAIKTDSTFINDLSTNASILNSSYYNILAISDGTTLTLYKNGTSLTTQTLNGSLSSTSLSYTISSAFETFAGNLASIQVYNRALTAAEIAQNYYATKSRYGL